MNRKRWVLIETYNITDKYLYLKKEGFTDTQINSLILEQFKLDSKYHTNNNINKWRKVSC